MDSSSIELKGSEIQGVVYEGGELRVSFSRAYIIKTMTGSTQRTKWWQAGDLVLEEAELESELPQGPLICDGGDVVENVFTYRDMIPVPLESRGHARCDLAFQGQQQRLKASGTAVRLEMREVAKYIDHID